MQRDAWVGKPKPTEHWIWQGMPNATRKAFLNSSVVKRREKVGPLLNEVRNLVTHNTGKCSGTKCAFASVSMKNTSSCKSQVPETRAKSGSRKIHSWWKRIILKNSLANWDYMNSWVLRVYTHEFWKSWLMSLWDPPKIFKQTWQLQKMPLD